MFFRRHDHLHVARNLPFECLKSSSSLLIEPQDAEAVNGVFIARAERNLGEKHLPLAEPGTDGYSRSIRIESMMKSGSRWVKELNFFKTEELFR